MSNNGSNQVPPPNGEFAQESWKVFQIMAEFVEGFERLSTIRPAVSIFGSARSPVDSANYQRTEEIAHLLSDSGFAVISGGGPGIMEAANKGGYRGRSPSIGLNIQLPMEQTANAVRATVALDFGERRVHGSATRPPELELECAAAGTALAIALGTEILVNVISTELVMVGAHRVCVTVVQLPGLGAYMSGSVVLDPDQDGPTVAAKSVLHATNRVITSPALVGRLVNRVDA